MSIQLTTEQIEEAARIFAFQCSPKEWKSFTPIHRKEGFKAGVAWVMEQLAREKIKQN